jgi:Fe-S-cluster containining protein
MTPLAKALLMTTGIERGNPAFPWHNRDNNPCTSCGACCAFFRVSFYHGECDSSSGGTVPTGMTETLTHFRQVMVGTNQKLPRCAALKGEIGTSVGCGIHPLRASVCRDFPPSWENGVHNPDCDRARAAHGLPPLENPDVVPFEPDDDEPPLPQRAA